MSSLTGAIRNLLLMVALAVLAGCSGGDRYADLREFMQEVEGKPRGTIAPLPEFEAYQAFTYGAANQRSPFEPPVIIPPKTEEQKRNVGVKPPKNHVKQYLERFPLSALAMVGTLQKDNTSFALIEDSQGGVHRVQVGDYMGDQWGQIESIEDTRIDVTEIVSDGAGGWLRRPRTIELRGFQ
ncbi:MAG: pilus assembly protein PilP [Pseudomonadales bacterium]|jgi:type IV pilus assembly protein PilP|nr:pilus assembly protein PilP [Pseudomonadales bacterium]